MSQLTTYIESPAQVILLKKFQFQTLIVDLPFCSIRMPSPYDWSNDELSKLHNLSISQLCLNLDGIYSDHELDIIADTIQTRRLDTIFNAVRIQDPGLILWLNDLFPSLKVQLNPETGFQNFSAIDVLFKKGLSVFTLNHETPYRVIKQFKQQQTNGTLELFVQGPILIQYSRRRFLSDLYERPSSSPIKLTAEDAELPRRKFTFLNTNFGHFMFAQFQRCLAKEASKLQQLADITWLIDARGESLQYFTTALHLYDNLLDHKTDTRDIFIQALANESQKPQKPGFFLANNTDYDWRDHSKQPESIGKILSVKKGDAMVLQFFESVTLPHHFTCLNPDNTLIDFDLTTVQNLQFKAMTHLDPFNMYLIVPPIKGIQMNGQLYFKDS